MHVHFLDPYHAGDSPIHSLDPRVKLGVILAFILTVALTPTGAWSIYILLLAFVLGAEILSGLGISFFLKRALLAIPFVLSALPVIFTIRGPTLISFTLGGWVLTATLPGVERFVSITLKSWISVQAAILLATTTNFPDLTLAMRAIGIPRLLVSTFGLMWRYLFVLADEAVRLIRARASRSSESDIPGLKTGGSVIWRAKTTGGMAGSLFLRAFERSDRIYFAMLSRGYDGEARSEPLPRLSTGSWLTLIICFILLALLLVLASFLRA